VICSSDTDSASQRAPSKPTAIRRSWDLEHELSGARAFTSICATNAAVPSKNLPLVAFDSPDKEKRCRLFPLDFTGEPVRTSTETAIYMQRVFRDSLEPNVPGAQVVREELAEQGGVLRSTLDLHARARNYRTVSVVLVNGPKAAQLSCDDYFCEDYATSERVLNPIRSSFRLRSTATSGETSFLFDHRASVMQSASSSVARRRRIRSRSESPANDPCPRRCRVDHSVLPAAGRPCPIPVPESNKAHTRPRQRFELLIDAHRTK
jgi:hypothetical protein